MTWPSQSSFRGDGQHIPSAATSNAPHPSSPIKRTTVQSDSTESRPFGPSVGPDHGAPPPSLSEDEHRIHPIRTTPAADRRLPRPLLRTPCQAIRPGEAASLPPLRACRSVVAQNGRDPTLPDEPEIDVVSNAVGRRPAPQDRQLARPVDAVRILLIDRVPSGAALCVD